jgi:hypothetical protein
VRVVHQPNTVARVRVRDHHRESVNLRLHDREVFDYSWFPATVADPVSYIVKYFDQQEVEGNTNVEKSRSWRGTPARRSPPRFCTCTNSFASLSIYGTTLMDI